MPSIEFEPLIPPSMFALIAIVGVIALIIYAAKRPGAVARRRWGLIVGMMTLGFACVLFTLLNPTFVRPLPGPSGKPLLTVLVDASASMNTADSSRGTTRYVSAVGDANQLVGRLSENYDVRVRRFSDQSESTNATALAGSQPTGRATDLAAAIDGALGDGPASGQAMVLLSDGINNTGTNTRVLESVRLAKAMNAPVYTRTFGGEVNTVDLSVELQSPQDMAFVGQQVPLAVHVKHVGAISAKTTVHVTRGNLEIARRDIEISPLGDSDLLFMVGQDKIGMYPYEVRVDPVAGEVTDENNSASYVLRVVDEPIRVLVLEGKPYWDSKFLVRTLAYDPAVALDCIVKVSDTRYLRRTLSRKDDAAANASAAASPTTPPRMEDWKIMADAQGILSSPERLRGYQIIVLGRDAEAFLNDDSVTALQSWISEDGGSLVCYRGEPTSQVTQKLSKLLPVQWSPTTETRFHVKLTDSGNGLNLWPQHEGTEVMSGLPSLVTSSQIVSTKPLAVMLATSTGSSTSAASPVVVYQQYGTGRVVVIEGAGMWRWAFLPPQYRQQEDIYQGLWHSMVRWLTSGSNSLTPGQRMMLRSDKVTFLSSEPATATLLIRAEGNRPAELPKIELTGSAGANTSFANKTFTPAAMGEEIGTYRVNFGNLPEGQYQAHIVGAKTEDASSLAVFDVRDLSQEQLDLRARPDLMARIATDSGGAVLGNDPPAEFEQAFKEHLERSHPIQVEHTPAWDRWWLLAGMLTVWGVSWIVRRSSGLV